METVIVKRTVCTAHQWYTPLDDGETCSHGDAYLETRYQPMTTGTNPDGTVWWQTHWRTNGDIVVYRSRSGARHYLNR